MDLKQENSLLRILLQIISDLNASFDRKNTGNIVVEGLKLIFRLESSFFYILDDKRENFVLETALNAEAEKESFPAGYGFVGWVGKSGEVLVLSDKSDKNDHTHFIAAPVKGKKSILGVIGGRRSGLEPFGADDKELITLFGSQVGAMVERYIYYERLQRSKELRDTILYNIPSGIIVVNPDRIIKTYNNSALLILGENAGIKGKSIYDIFSEDSLLTGISRIIEKETAPKNLELARKEKLLNISLVPIPGDRSDSSDIMIVIVDLTDVKKAYEEKERAERLSSLGQFAAGIAHELRNPLTGINILLEMVREDPGISGESAGLIDKVLSENSHLEEMVTSMLEITKPMDLKLTELKLNQVLSDFLGNVKKIAEKRNIELERKGIGSDVMVMLDEKKINQALLNLFNNSMDGMSGGGRFTIGLSLEGDKAVITIEDTGTGVPSGVMERIFEPFYTTKQTGTGLGLHITRSIIKHHKGSITAASDGRTYTRFKIRLPLVRS